MQSKCNEKQRAILKSVQFCTSTLLSEHVCTQNTFKYDPRQVSTAKNHRGHSAFMYVLSDQIVNHIHQFLWGYCFSFICLHLIIPILTVLQHTMKAVSELQGAHCQQSSLLCATVWIQQGDFKRSFYSANLSHHGFPFHPGIQHGAIRCTKSMLESTEYLAQILYCTK